MTSALPENIQLCLPLSFAVLPGGFSRSVESSSSETTSSKDGSAIFPLDPTKPFIAYHPSFLTLLGDAPSLSIIASSETALGGDGRRFAHEAGVWIEETQEVWFTSNLSKDPSPRNIISVLKISPDAAASGNVTFSNNWADISPTPDVVTGNGATLYDNQLLVCSQGLGRDIPSSLSLIDVRSGPPYASRPVLNNFHGRAFNSVNDVVILPPPNLDNGPHPTTDRVDLHSQPHTTIWFTDPTYGHAQAYKPAPELPNQVYCFNPTTGDVRVVADGFGMPNGICFNWEGTKCYITDTAVLTGPGTGEMKIYPDRPSTIYVYDLVRPPPGADLTASGPTLHNRRVFAYADSGVPDGIKCDKSGNVYSGCGDGVHVWNEFGTLIGKILLGPDQKATTGAQLKEEKYKTRYCANFNFIPGGRLVIFAEDRIYLAKIGGEVEGALLP